VVAGGDGAAFTINSGSGVLVFASAPDFETPTDADADNIYVVTIRATWTEESLTDDVTYYITVTNVAE
jgi:serralysin